ncbi:MAG: SPOR domain-containing protein [Planctomycetota bacterium]|nr:SPOR domain-containing protein [Planctomycetota bacterium]
MDAIRTHSAARCAPALLLVTLFLSSMGGCAKSHPIDLRPIQAAYTNGDYRGAYDQGHAISESPIQPLSARQKAAYFAGLSAYRLNNLDRAQQELTLASQSPDKQISADAKATLGLVFDAQGRYGLASDSLMDAAQTMTGQDKANAYFYAARAQQKMGRWPVARTSLSMALSNSRDPAFRARVQEQMRITGFTIQTGAFEVEDNARTAAEQLANKVASMRLGRPRVVASVDPGSQRRLYLVQVGQFTSWPTALQARDRIATTKSIIVPLAGT